MNELLWWLSRATGVMAFVMLTVSTALGIATRSGRDVGGLGRFGVAEIHRTASLSAASLLVVHVVALFLDTDSGISVLHGVVPFTSGYARFGVGLGVLALDLVVAVVVTALLRHRLGPRVFRVVHRTAYALWPLAALHFLLSGTDAGTWWAITLLVASTAAVLAAVAWRLSPGFVAGGRPRRTAAGVLEPTAPARRQRVAR